MSEEALNQEPTDELTPEPATEIPQEERPKGHISKDDWIAMGRDGEEWRSADAFEERGKWIKRVQDLENRVSTTEQSAEDQVRHLNAFHEAKIKDLKVKQREAVELGDTEQYDALDKQIDETKGAQAVAPVNNGATAEAAWNTANPWINQPGPKSTYAISQYGVYSKQGMTAQQALQMVDQDIKREFPSVNTARQAAPTSEGGSKPGGRRESAGKLSWGDLSSTEVKYYNSLGSKAFGSKSDYLKTVANSRKGE